jgi:ATP-binding cassette, subfamily A (ABC1), member 3
MANAGLFSIINSEGQHNHEPNTDPSLIPRVEIRKLVKLYNKKSGNRPAVNNLSFTLYQDQITALLGSNGAGKSTIIGLLTGLIHPTSGDCFIDGSSIVNDTLRARRSIGICPQANVLFDRLTVREHIALFMRIKGTRPSKAEVQQRAIEVGLEEYFLTMAGSLSGGNKRKLSLALALCGDPNFLVLDEPTSGMGKWFCR